MGFVLLTIRFYSGLQLETERHQQLGLLDHSSRTLASHNYPDGSLLATLHIDQSLATSTARLALRGCGIGSYGDGFDCIVGVV